MYYIGIDIGSTAAKVSVFKDEQLLKNYSLPTGWSSVETAAHIKEKLALEGVLVEESKVVATGYGRVSVPYAHKTITEITCHGKGAFYLLGENCTVIDIGGQDTKIITVEDGNILDFIMNDKCAAGTGRFLELMANTLGMGIMELCEKAKDGKDTTISSMCTVFAESEVISLIGGGKKREDIAYAVVDSISTKVKALCLKHAGVPAYFLTGGLCDTPYLVEQLSLKLQKPVKTHGLARYAGSIGAALAAKQVK